MFKIVFAHNKLSVKFAVHHFSCWDLMWHNQTLHVLRNSLVFLTWKTGSLLIVNFLKGRTPVRACPLGWMLGGWKSSQQTALLIKYVIVNINGNGWWCNNRRQALWNVYCMCSVGLSSSVLDVFEQSLKMLTNTVTRAAQSARAQLCGKCAVWHLRPMKMPEQGLSQFTVLERKCGCL